MQKIILIILIFLSKSISMNAQITKTYKGIIKDKSSNEIISYATITAYNDTLLIDGTLSNNDGEFQLNINQIHSHLSISFIGYQDLIINTKDIHNNEDLLIELTQQFNDLDQITIQSERTTTQLKIDRKIINLGTDIQNAGTSALEAFDQISEIQTDLGTGSISLRGSGNVRVLINGKPSSMNPTELLDQIPSSTIDRIEIITSPSAKNQADGLAGIINIILKKNNAQGYNAALNAAIGTKRYQYGFDTNINFSKINFRLNASTSRRNMNSEQWILQEYVNGDTRSFYSPHDFKGNIKRINSGLDFFISESDVLSFQMDYTNDFHSFSNNTYYTNITNKPDYTYTRNSSHTHNTSNYNLNYRSNTKIEDHFFEVDYNFSNNKNIFPAEDFENDIYLFNELQSNSNQLHAFSIDYAFPLKNFKLETGSSWNYRKLDSNKDVSFNGTNILSDIFTYQEHILGLYFISNYQFNNINIQSGIRYENFNSQSNNTFSKELILLDFSNFFPSLHLSYKPNTKNTFAIGYSRRIARPSFRNINPFQIGNQYFQWQSNPELTPEFSDNFEINQLYIGQKLSTSFSISYRHRMNVIQWVDKIDSEGVRFVSFENQGSRNTYGIESNFQYKLSKVWDTNISANYYYTKANQVNITFDQLYNSNLILKNTINLTKNISTDLSYILTPNSQNTYDYTATRNRIDLAVRAKFLKNKLVFNLRIVDLLNRNLRHKTTVLPNVQQLETWKFQSQTFGFLLSMNYKLFQNAGKTVKRKKRNYSHDGTID